MSAAVSNSQKSARRALKPLDSIEELEAPVPNNLNELLTKLNTKQLALPHTCKSPNGGRPVLLMDQKPFVWFEGSSSCVYKLCKKEMSVELEVVLMISNKLFQLTPGELPPADALVRCKEWKDGTPHYFREKPDYIFSVVLKTYPPRLVPLRKFIWQVPTGIEQMDAALLSDKGYFADKVLQIYINRGFSLVERSIEMDPVVRYNFKFTVLQQSCRPTAQPVTAVKIEQMVTKPSNSVRDLFARSS
jgi:hypothetical protein